MRIEESCVARRRFLCGMLGGGAAALGSAVAAPLLRYLGNVQQKPPPPFLEIPEADCRLSPGGSRTLMYGRIPVLMLRTRENDLRIFVAICTHFDCTVGYQEQQNRIFCACHEGYYDLDGQVLSGPPPEPLRQFYFKFTDHKLVIALEKENLEKAS